jgi:ubiquitin-protein ligase
MIQFACRGCGKSCAIADEFAGRTVRCKACATVTRVPSPAAIGGKIVINVGATPSAVPPVKAKVPPGTRRLLADAEQMRRAFEHFSLIQVQSVSGNPPDLYRVAYRVHGLARGPEGQPLVRDQHVVEIQLTLDYPRQSPKCKILTPIFHPNFDPTVICVGDHWTAGERLVDLVIRIGEMIAYQAYNVKSPLDGEAAMWANLNQQHFPVDPRDLRPPNLE